MVCGALSLYFAWSFTMSKVAYFHVLNYKALIILLLKAYFFLSQMYKGYEWGGK